MTFLLNYLYRIQVQLLFAAIIIISSSSAIYALPCTTIANNTWDCGTPSPSDDLVVNHNVTINSSFSLTGSITVNNGGNLTIMGNVISSGSTLIVQDGGTIIISGNVTLDNNCNWEIYGDVQFENALTVKNSTFSILSGSISVNGNVTIDDLSSFTVGSGVVGTFSNKFTTSSNDFTLDGEINIDGNFTNNNTITGVGLINYTGNCSGGGTINGVSSATYCGSGTIELSTIGSCGTDTEDPVISNMPTNITAYATAGSCDASVNWSAPTASDNCSLQSFTSTHSSGDVFPIGTTSITYTATDASANSVSASFNITVLDSISPSISNMPSNIAQNADAGVCGAIVNWTLPTATDNCSASLSSSHNSSDFFNVGTTIVTYTALDIHGNSTVLTFGVTINDNIPPAISNMPSDITQNADAGSCGAIVNWTLPTATDNCSASLSSSHNPGNFFNVGTTTVMYTALDIHGNSTTLSFDVTINDNIPPTISNMPTDITQNVDAGSCGAIVNWTLPTAADNCSTSLSSSHNPGDFFAVGTTTVTYTALDIHGNSTVLTFGVTINDNIPPAISNMPTGITQNADAGSCGAIVNWTLPTAADNCSTSLSSSHNPGDFFAVGTTIVTYTALDIHGNSTVLTFGVTINDNIPPAISNMPTGITQNADAGSCGAIVNWTLPTAADNCSTSLSSSHNPGDFFVVGTTIVTYTALDIHGNSTVLTFGVTINDNFPPAISNMPTGITQNADAGSCGAIVNWTLPTATDNCSASLSSSHNPGDFFAVGTTIVTYTALDIHGNSTVLTFGVTINDNIPPAISNMPSDITQNADAGVCGAIVNWTLPTAADNCSASLSSSHNPGDFFDVGKTTVSYTALDINGNSKVQTFDVMIIDNISPTIVNMPSDITQNAFVGSCGAIVNWTAPNVTDYCSTTISSSHKPGDFFDLGTTTVTYTANDNSGNTIEKNFNITVADKSVPMFSSCPTKFEVISIDTIFNTSIITWEEPIAKDPCSSITMSSNYKPGDTFNFGVVTVFYTATDQNGHEAICSLEVVSGYNHAPVINHSNRKAKAGEPLDIVIDAQDPDGDQVFIEYIANNENNSTITDIDFDKLVFVYTAFEDFHGFDTVQVTIADNGSPSSSALAELVIEVEGKSVVEVSSAITINGDMINDHWHIENIDLFPDNSVYIYDRWGGLVYKTSGYDNTSIVWNGSINQKSLGNQTIASTGTYFYVIDLGNGYEKLTGAVEVIR